MAGDWIKLEHATLHKPEVYRIAELLNVSRREAIGILLDFWVWLDRNSCNGSVTLMSRKSVEDVTHCPGFSACLIEVGWAKWNEKTGQLTITNFDRHNGSTAKTRALTRDRVAASRNDDVTEKQRKCNAPSVTREEKRRDKENIKRNIPDDFIASESVRAWALKTGVENLDQHVVAFIDTCKAKGYKYVDWDAALRKAVKDNWARIQPKALRVVAL